MEWQWDKEAVAIEYKYARVKFGDLFDLYTTADGVLRLPEWRSFKYAVDEFLEDNPRTKFYPSRVHAFIEEHGVEQLERME